MPGYSLESSNTLDVIFLIGFLMAALKKKVFGACSSSEQCRLNTCQVDQVNEVDLTLNNFKMESHRSLQRIIVVCSSTQKHFLSSLMVVSAQRKSILHLRPQRTTTASCNRVWKS